jgi:acyl carrier protein
VRPGSGADLGALREALDASGARPTHIVQTWGIGADGDAADAHARGYASVASVAAAFARETSDALRVTVVTEAVQDVAGGEPVHPSRAAVLGACAVLPHEHPHVAVRTVDVQPRPGSADRLADQLLAEVTADAADRETALRGPVRWVRDYTPARAAEGAAGLREGGAYLFSGAPSAAGGVLMEHLAKTLGARIALVVDPAIPEREEWDAHPADAAHRHDTAVHTIGWLRGLETHGVAPLLVRAPLDDAGALRTGLERARQAFGRIDGIVHAPGLGGAAGYAPLADARPESAAAELDRLDRELSALREATDGVELDFVLLQGSLVPAAGGSGVGPAAAAYALMDAWAQRVAAEGGGPWTSIAWDRWRMEDGEDAAGAGFSRTGGLSAFERAAALAGEPRVLATPGDPAAPAARPGSSAAAAADGDEAALHPRPALRSDFHPPATPAEESIAAVWRELFGIRDIGVRDDFFQLGGHSLLAMQLVSRVRDLFQVDIPLPAVFEAPTIAGLTDVINEAMLLELESMSDEEAENELSFHASGGRGGEARISEAASPHLLLAALDELSDEALDRLLAGDAGEGTFE